MLLAPKVPEITVEGRSAYADDGALRLGFPGRDGVKLDDGRTLYSHNQLYGRWYVEPRGAWPLPRRWRSPSAVAAIPPPCCMPPATRPAPLVSRCTLCTCTTVFKAQQMNGRLKCAANAGAGGRTSTSHG